MLKNCYLCDSTKLKPKKGQVRDREDLKILECQNCGLVFLDSHKHLHQEHYEKSGMHGENLLALTEWLQKTNADDQRRFDLLTSLLPGKKVLDFGCGAGGFLSKVQPLAAEVTGIEPERRVQEFWRDSKIRIYSNIEQVPSMDREKYDLITAFHVVEHLPNPREILKKLANDLLSPNGRLVIEVPSSDDALITLYDCNAFQSFTYWSQHLYLFNGETLKQLARQAGLRVLSIQQFQRYPLSNHLYWLSREVPGGHQKWSFLDTTDLNNAYAASLAAIGKCDTLIAHLEIDK
jgi:2-polyprenyl-3-methyl-5-hydroxy-6-metoxy-1,4-benzoquinol methylase